MSGHLGEDGGGAGLGEDDRGAGLGEDGGGACEQFWKMPELVVKLLRYLDLSSTKFLAESHELTRQILRKEFVWNKLIQRILPREERVTFPPHHDGLFEDDSLFVSERQKAKILAEILNLITGTQRGLQFTGHGKLLLHTISARYPVGSPIMIDLACACRQTHRVSAWAFMILEEAEASLGPRANASMMEIDTVKMMTLRGPLLMALASNLVAKQGTIENLDVESFGCKSDAEAVAIGTVVARSRAVSDANSLRISTEGVGREGWAAVARAVVDLWLARGKDVEFSSDPKTMGTGQREDLKAIWDNVSEWLVHGGQGDDGYRGAFRFTKEFDGEEGWWDRRGYRRGLEAFIDMPVEEWDAEMDRFRAEDEAAAAEAEAALAAGAGIEAEEGAPAPGP